MPVPDPTTLELAQAGATIVGIQRRQERLDAVLRATRRWEHLLLILASVILFALNLVGLITIISSRGEQTGPWVAAIAGTLTMIGLAIAYTRAAGTSQADLGYSPEQLADLVGYVNVDDGGNLRTSELGTIAIKTYNAWSDPIVERQTPTAPSDPVSEHRPLEGA